MRIKIQIRQIRRVCWIRRIRWICWIRWVRRIHRIRVLKIAQVKTQTLLSSLLNSDFLNSNVLVRFHIHWLQYCLHGHTQKIYIDIASINSKNREAGKLNKRCLTLDEKIKILVEVKKRKLSCEAIDEELKVRKTQATNFVKNDAKLRKELKTFKEKAINISKERLTKNLNILMTFFILRLKNVRLLAFI